MKTIFLLTSLTILISFTDVLAQEVPSIQKEELEEQVVQDKEFLKEKTEDENFSYEIDPSIFDNTDYHAMRENEAGEIEIIMLPDCNDESLIRLVKYAIEDYQIQNPASTVWGKRKQALMLKKLSSFEEIPATDITSKEDILLANDLIKIKINEGVRAENMRICRGPKVQDKNYLYLLLYIAYGDVNVKIVNFVGPGEDKSGLDFIYFKG